MSMLKSIIAGALLAVPIISNAYVIPGPLDANTHASQGFSDNSEASNSTFTDDWNFSLSADLLVGASITNTAGTAPLLSSFSAWFDGDANGNGGIPLSLQVIGTGTQVLFTPASVFLTQGSHILYVKGTNTSTTASGSYGGNISVSSVPVPAALWLMGTALIGLYSVRKGKTGLAA